MLRASDRTVARHEGYRSNNPQSYSWGLYKHKSERFRCRT